jgi:hypothetical protein
MARSVDRLRIFEVLMHFPYINSLIGMCTVLPEAPNGPFK